MRPRRPSGSTRLGREPPERPCLPGRHAGQRCRSHAAARAPYSALSEAAANRRIPAFAQVAEADGNRTRRRRSAPSTGFEDRGDHQAPRRLRVDSTAAAVRLARATRPSDSRRQAVQVPGEQRALSDVLSRRRPGTHRAPGRYRIVGLTSGRYVRDKEMRERRRARVVGGRGGLPGVPAQLRRRGRQRRGRPAGTAVPPGVPGRPRRGRRLADPLLPVPAGRRRIRRQRLLRRGPAARDHGGLRPSGQGRRRVPDPGHRRPGAEPLLQRASAVPRRAGGGPRQPGAGPVHLPRRARPRRRTAAEQLDVEVRRPRLDPGDRGRRPAGTVVPAPVRHRPAGLELAEPGRARPVRAGDQVLARPRRSRPAGGRGARDVQGPGPA